MWRQVMGARPEQRYCRQCNEQRADEKRCPALYTCYRDNQRTQRDGCGEQCIIETHQPPAIGVTDYFVDPGLTGYQQTVGCDAYHHAQGKPDIQVIKAWILQ